MAEKSTARKVEAEESTSGGSAAHATAGLLQAGEAAEILTTRVPRGVAEPAADAVAEHEGVAALQRAVQEQLEAENARGYRGSQVDTTPNYNYTLRGVGEGKPTPETVVYTPKGR